MKVSKKVPFVAYTIICVVLLLLLLSGIGYITGFTSNAKRNHSDNQTAILNESNAENNGKDEMSLVSSSTTNITNYKIDCGYGKVTIKTTTEQPYIKFSDESAFSTKTYTSGNEMEIQLSSSNYFGNDFINNLFHNRVREAVIYLPATQLDNVTVIASANDLSLRDLNVKMLDVHLSAGDVQVKDCTVEEMKSELNAGNFEFYANKGIQRINSEVNAGNMDLYLPKDIAGFDCDYDVSLGNLDNNSRFEVKGDTKNHFVNQNGTFTYGDESTKITLDVSAGNISLDDYQQ